MPNPTVSVIVPVWKSERYIAQTLRSALTQTFDDLEVLIVDDGSPDGSIDIRRKFPDPRIRYLRQPNRGLAAARNMGLHHARGEFIAFLDSDDRLENPAYSLAPHLLPSLRRRAFLGHRSPEALPPVRAGQDSRLCA